jgi:hypothetical protein
MPFSMKTKFILEKAEWLEYFPEIFIDAIDE